MRHAERAALIFLLGAVSSAAHAESRQPIELPAGRLGPAIVVLGRQAGISIGISDPALASLPVRRVSGKITVKQALAQLLKGSDARAISLGDNGWRIVRTRARPGPQRASMAAALPVAPDDAPEAEIVVTGSKRAMPLAGYPGSVSVMTMADFPAGADGAGTDAIASRLPGVNSTHLGSGRNKLFMRGIADSSFNGPTQATVGQYLGETRLNYNAPDPDLRLYDIATIEVLQGPQGTLHGAGSLGGVLRILPVSPRMGATQASLALSGGSTAHGGPSYDGSAMINLPVLGDKVALRAVGYAVRDGGYIDDSLRDLQDVNRTDTYGGRLALRAEPGSGWTIELGGALQSIRGDDSQSANRDLPDLTKASPVAQAFANDYALGQIVIRKDWDNGLSFVSASGAVRQDISETYDATPEGGAPALFRQKSRISLLSSENRLSHDGGGSVSWVVGTSLVRNRYRLNRLAGQVSFARAVTGVSNGVDEATLFGEMTLRVAPAVNLTGGGRLTYARLSGEALDTPVAVALATRMQAQRGETTVLPSLAISYAPHHALTLFARYQEGFRPGGIAVRNEIVQRYQNDDVSSAELGLRYGGRGDTGFDAAISLVHTRWRDIQADLIDGFGLPGTANIGDGRIWSVDAALGWRPVPGLRIEAAGVFADSRLTSPQVNVVVLRSSLAAGAPISADAVIAESNALPNVARFNGRIGAEYATILGGDYDFRLSGWARYVGRSRLGIGPVLGVAQGDFLDTAMSVRIGRGGYGLFLSATNLLDTIGNRFSLGSPFTLPHESQITPLRPRTIRIGMDVRF
ncbi:TonB-dependent receptor domain-containing protein [Sphingobium boeckii]|uniref:Outer membrane receptor protein involved in Fe transport n=1 Tax=Sphingobium boeckii TaxID=1082345 RepID=A0A7W9AJ58_9SPHN|nr:TonB-dependent receptor [Sphingobium boeckii]MBB5686595.1 outer membrane receptor protein involved in Fe transport [Sphingobium boeckii]